MSQRKFLLSFEFDTSMCGCGVQLSPPSVSCLSLQHLWLNVNSNVGGDRELDVFVLLKTPSPMHFDIKNLSTLICSSVFH